MVFFMKSIFLMLAAARVWQTAEASPLERRVPTCTDFTIPVTASASTQNFQSPVINLFNIDTLLEGLISTTSLAAGKVLSTLGTVTTSGTYEISMRYCEPANYVASRANTIQYLQHAITLTKDYWAGMTYPMGYMGDEYSWIQYASEQGYPTLSVDNLGSGDSEHPDPILEVQQTVQVAIIHQIIQMLRQGTIPNSCLKGHKFAKIIYVGHSYGTLCGNAIATHFPGDVDAFVYEGYTTEYALGAVPLAGGILLPAFLVSTRFSSLISQPFYLAMSSQTGRRNALYTNVGGYDPNIVSYDFQHEGTVALGEIATLLYGLGPAPSFRGDVLTITGQEDAVCCYNVAGNNCGTGPSSLPAKAQVNFPAVRNFTYYIPGSTGHSPNLHYSAPAIFVYAHQWLKARGY